MVHASLLPRSQITRHQLKNAKKMKRVSTDAPNTYTVSTYCYLLEINVAILYHPSIQGIQEKLGILHNGEVYAVFSYDAQQSDELSFVVNDRLTILRKGDDAEREWWWAKNANGEEGYVPRNLLGVSTEDKTQKKEHNKESETFPGTIHF